MFAHRSPALEAYSTANMLNTQHRLIAKHSDLMRVIFLLVGSFLALFRSALFTDLMIAVEMAVYSPV